MIVTVKTASDGKVRKLTGVEKLDWCAKIGNINKIENPFTRNMFKQSRARSPNFLKKCPLIGISSMINFTQDKNVMKMLPLGTYTLRNKIYDDQKVKQLRMEITLNFSMVPE